MTINNLNNLLASFSEQKRENILSFSFALLEWMGIVPNTDVPGAIGEIRPRLLSPQTQKLKEFLAQVPQTVQPQLYRLSAEGQNIRVRFAVLKKLKKDTISQLVDNDPGLTSYQASIKGIVNVPGRPPYIPQQPCFIHFVTTPAYDKLVLTVNQNEQKRLVTFRNRLTKTQFHKILEKWQNIGTKSKPEIVEILWKSLDIKEVNKEFYKQIKERFDSLVGFAKTYNTGLNEEAVKQFAVRLIGRYIFCWFLKEKGVIPPALLSSDTIQNYKDSFFQLFLKKLFFKTLNAEVTAPCRTETITLLDNWYKTIPYLNGGLFDYHAEDVLFNKLDLNNWLITFVKVLEEFDFTVDESNSQYQMVAIDPEMLGRIFENLLASQNPETEKMANQRKAFGAFYTPREIVDYMVNESLKAYLENQLMPVSADDSFVLNEPLVEYKGTLFQHLEPQQTLMDFQDKKYNADNDRRREKIKTNIAKLFSPDCPENPFDKEDTILVRKALSEITVFDPACGSGAFPMGVMLRLMELRQIVGHGHRNNYDLKSEILSKNIYGVDIMPMAIEIARLRAWLSLVLEADYKPADRKNNFGIAALPNLDFKFVCANSLIDSGYDEFLAKIKYNQTLYHLDGEIQKLQRIRDEYFDPKGDNHKKAVLQKEFNETKEYIKDQINTGTLIKNYNLENFFEKVDDWNPFDDSHPSSFFSPAWMFGINNGFDVVIGNPPYVKARDNKNKEYRFNIEKQYKTTYKMWDLYIPFIERSISLLKVDGLVTMIIPDTIGVAEYSEKLVNLIEKEHFLRSIVFFPAQYLFENAMVRNKIISIDKRKNASCKMTIRWKYNGTIFEKLGYLNGDQKYLFETSNYVFNNTNCIPLGDICYVSYGLRLNSDKSDENKFQKKDLISEKHTDIHTRKYTEGKYIDKYYIDKTYWLEWGTERCPGRLVRATFPELYFPHKLLLARQKKVATISIDSEICDNTIIVAVLHKDIKSINNSNIKKYYSNIKKNKIELIKNSLQFDLKFLVAIINSNLMKYFLNYLTKGKIDIYPDDWKEIPIKLTSLEKQIYFADQVEKILSLKKQNQDTTSLEKEIDVLVYKLYGLTLDEVKIVDPSFALTEEEYKDCGIQVN